MKKALKVLASIIILALMIFIIGVVFCALSGCETVWYGIGLFLLNISLVSICLTAVIILFIMLIKLIKS